MIVMHIATQPKWLMEGVQLMSRRYSMQDDEAQINQKSTNY